MYKYYNFGKYFLLFVFLLITNLAFSQQHLSITGKVTDEDGESLPGATVMIIGEESRGTVTDIDGNYQLVIPQGMDNELISFSYIGYITEEVSIDNRSVIDMRLIPDLQSLSEIVVVGYGTMKRSDLTGAISTVSASDLKQGVITSAEQLLQGKVAGLTIVQPSGDPTQGSSIRLRGGTSLSASNSPLVVVDGIPGVDMNTVQPHEILSIDILKDASAAAIYGSRGANGVIIVTTNRENAGVSINYNGYVAVGQVAKNLDLLSANQWRGYVRDNNVVGAIDYGADTDWQKELQRTSISQSHNLSFSNGSEDSGFRASVSWLESQGVIKTSGLERLAGSLTGYQKGLDNRLKLEIGIHANQDDYNPVDMGIYERAYNLNPTLPVKQNGEYTQIGGTNNNNPVELLFNRNDDQSRKRLLGFTKVDIDIFDDLKGVVNGSYEYNLQQGRFFLPSYSFNGQTDKGYANRNESDYSNLQLETYLSYSKEIGYNRVNAMAGYSYLKNMYEGFGSERRGFDTNLFTYNNLAAGNDFRLGDVYSYKGEAKLISFFGRLNYAYRDKYMITGTLRNDGSSRFGDNNKWGLFPSASVAWRVSEEDFMDSIRGWLSNFKIRAGYGVTGNQDGIGEYKSISLMGTGTGAYYDQATDSWKQSYGVSQNPNPNLKWESTVQTNLGFDLTLLNKFNVVLDLYSKKTSDLLYTYNVPQPPYLFDKMMANVGDLSNKGVELSIDGNIVKVGDFSWNANVVLAHNKQEVLKLSNDLYQTEQVASGNLHGLTGMSGVYTQMLKEGYPVGTFWGPKSLGVDENGEFIFELDEDGEPINEYLGSAQPKLTLGLGTNLSYKDFDLSLAFNGMFGQKILNAQAMNISYPGRLPGYNVLDSWLKDGENITEGPIYSDYWIEKGDFLRLQTVTLGYNVPLSSKMIQKLRFYFTGENLLTFTSYSGIDPEVNFSGLKSPGIDKSVGDSNIGDNYYYPRARTYTFGINLTF